MTRGEKFGNACLFQAGPGGGFSFRSSETKLLGCFVSSKDAMLSERSGKYLSFLGKTAWWSCRLAAEKHSFFVVCVI